MRDLVTKIVSGSLVEAKSELDAKFKSLFESKLRQIKERLAVEIYGEAGFDVDIIREDEDGELDESNNVMRSGRSKVIRIRIRGGKVQRRKKFSAVKGYTYRGGRLIRMSSAERRHRKMAAKRSKYKRRAKLKQSLRKRRQSLRKRKAMGV